MKLHIYILSVDGKDDLAFMSPEEASKEAGNSRYTIKAVPVEIDAYVRDWLEGLEYKYRQKIEELEKELEEMTRLYEDKQNFYKDKGIPE